MIQLLPWSQEAYKSLCMTYGPNLRYVGFGCQPGDNPPYWHIYRHVNVLHLSITNSVMSGSSKTRKGELGHDYYAGGSFLDVGPTSDFAMPATGSRSLRLRVQYDTYEEYQKIAAAIQNAFPDFQFFWSLA